MNLYDIYLHDFGGQSGSQIIAANNPTDAVRAFVETKEGSAALEKSTGAELRVFKRTGGVVLQNKFEPSQPETPLRQSPDGEGVPIPPVPPVAPQPAPSPLAELSKSFAPFMAGLAAGAMFARSPKPAAKKKSTRKK